MKNLLKLKFQSSISICSIQNTGNVMAVGWLLFQKRRFEFTVEVQSN